MTKNFWYDAFAADKAEPVTVRPVTRAERIENLRNGIDRLQRLLAKATTQDEASRHEASLRVRQTNLANLIG